VRLVCPMRRKRIAALEKKTRIRARLQARRKSAEDDPASAAAPRPNRLSPNLARSFR
jgi:hypothetical protein